MVIMEERRCFVKFEPRLNPEISSHCIWHYLVHTERDNSFFWLKQKCDSLDFQVFWHSLKKFSCRLESNTHRVCSNTHLASTQRQPVPLSAPTWWRAQIWLLQQGHTGCEILWLMHNHINSLHIILTVYTQGVHNQKARTVERQLYWVMCSARCPRPDELPKLLVFLTIGSVSQNSEFQDDWTFRKTQNFS